MSTNIFFVLWRKILPQRQNCALILLKLKVFYYFFNEVILQENLLWGLYFCAFGSIYLCKHHHNQDSPVSSSHPTPLSLSQQIDKDSGQFYPTENSLMHRSLQSYTSFTQPLTATRLFSITSVISFQEIL